MPPLPDRSHPSPRYLRVDVPPKKITLKCPINHVRQSALIKVTVFVCASRCWDHCSMMLYLTWQFLKGAGRVGHGSHALLFRLWEGKSALFLSLLLLSGPPKAAGPRNLVSYELE